MASAIQQNSSPSSEELLKNILSSGKIGLIAGNSPFPFRFVEEAKKQGLSVVALCHKGETDPSIESLVDECTVSYTHLTLPTI